MLPPKDLCAIPAAPGVLSRFAPRESWRPAKSRRKVSPSTLSTEYFDDPIAACADDPSTVLTPGNAANAFAAHDTVACDFLRAGALLERPETQTCIMAGGDEFTAIGREGE
jgi:hypothetical protein